MARRFGRRKRPRVAWMPTFGGEAVVEHPAAPWPGIEAELIFNPADPVGDGVLYNAFPLTFDASEGAVEAAGATGTTSIREIVQGNEWRLRRIVGKAFVTTWHSTLGSGYASALDVALGFIVSNCHDDGSPTTDFNDVNPLSQDSMEDPWIWRRRWLLNPWDKLGANTTSTQNFVADGAPQDNLRHGSVADGPHVDAKTARVIHRSERLFAVLAARRWGAFGNADPPAPGYSTSAVRMLLDYRLVGSLRGSTYGNRGKTSR